MVTPLKFAQKIMCCFFEKSGNSFLNLIVFCQGYPQHFYHEFVIFSGNSFWNYFQTSSDIYLKIPKRDTLKITFYIHLGKTSTTLLKNSDDFFLDFCRNSSGATFFSLTFSFWIAVLSLEIYWITFENSFIFVRKLLGISIIYYLRQFTFQCPKKYLCECLWKFLYKFVWKSFDVFL